MKHILIIGGGFGGVQAAITLSKKLDKEKYNITLLSNHETFFLYPFSIWLPVGKRTVQKLSLSLHDLSSKYGFEFVKERVISVKTEDRIVKTNKSTYLYDYVIFSFGTQPIAIEGIENVYRLCSDPEELQDAYTQLQMLVAKGSGTIVGTFGVNPDEATINRAGPLLEVLLNVESFLRSKARRESFKLIFVVENWSYVERSIGNKALDMVKKVLLQRNIAIIAEKEIKSIGHKNILFTDGTGVESDLTFYAPGLKAGKLCDSLDFPLSESGFIPIDSACSVLGSENCFAVGDCTTYQTSDWGLKQGRIAEIMGTTAAKNIIAKENNTKPLHFNTDLEMIFILDMGTDGIIIANDKERNVARKGLYGHWAKLALERMIRLNYR